MNAPKFTSGPWGFRVSESGGIAIFNSEGIWIAATLRKAWPQEDRANARLMAAAPELFNALSVLIDAADARGIPVDAARAALAKAVS
jgi:hypothetical protein